MGPTPPGLGDTHAATSATAGSTSPAMRVLPSGFVTRETPTSSTIAPGLTLSAVTIEGEPAAATITSALRRCSSKFTVPVWVSVTVALTSLRVRSDPMGRPTVIPRPITTTFLPAHDRPWCSTRSITPRGVQGNGESIGPEARSTSRPRLVGCRPSASFSGSIRSRIASVSMCLGNGSCTM